MRLSRPGERAKPGKRKNGVRAFAPASPLTARSTAAIPRSTSASAAAAHVAEQRMREAVMRDRVALGELALGERRGGRCVAAQQEKGGVHAFMLERVEQFRGRAGPRSIIEGEHHLLRRERERRGKLLAADARRRRWLTAGARSVPSASGLPGHGSARAIVGDAAQASKGSRRSTRRALWIGRDMQLILV
jgi:hypothetical protein